MNPVAVHVLGIVAESVCYDDVDNSTAQTECLFSNQNNSVIIVDTGTGVLTDAVNDEHANGGGIENEDSIIRQKSKIGVSGKLEPLQKNQTAINHALIILNFN